ncbi:MAG: hypothetical protein ACO3N7_09435 [Kiritimatiellia bacterium]
MTLTARVESSGASRLIRNGWNGLAGVFLFLAVDEFSSLHEMLNTPVKALFSGTYGVFHFAWVIPYGILVLILGAVYVPFLLKLPRRTAVHMVIAGVVYMSGALVSEMAGSFVADLHGGETLSYALLYTLEETLEMLGIACLIFTLLSHLSVEEPDIRLRIGEGRAS